MKSFLLLFTFFFCLSIDAFSTKLNLYPIQKNYLGIITSDNIVIAYSSAGTALVSSDNEKTWTEVKIFDYDEAIVKIFNYTAYEFTAISSKGRISRSSENGMKWAIIKELPDPIVAAEWQNGYYILRAHDKLIKASEDFEYIAHTPLKYNNTLNYFGELRPRSISVSKSFIAVMIDSLNVLKYDHDLNLVASFNLRDIDTTINIQNHYYIIASDDKNIYLNTRNLNLIKIDSSGSFKKYENYPALPADSGYVVGLKSINGKSYIITKTMKEFGVKSIFTLYELDELGDLVKKLELNWSEYSTNPNTSLNMYNINDFLYDGNRLIIAGEGNLLFTYRVGTGTKNVVSEFKRTNKHDFGFVLAEMAPDSSLLLVSNNNPWFTPAYKSDDFGATWRHERNDTLLRRYNKILQMENYVRKGDRISILGYYFQGGENKNFRSFYTDDFGKTWNSKELPYVKYESSMSLNTMNFKLNAIDDGYMVSFENDGKSKAGTVVHFDDNFEIKTVKLYDPALVEAISVGADTILFLNYDGQRINAENMYLVITKNGGISWDTLTQYKQYISAKGTLIPAETYCQKFNLKGRDYWLIRNLNSVDSTANIDLVDLQDFRLIHLIKNKIPGLAIPKISFCFTKDTLYLQYNSNIFLITDPEDKNSWKRYILPDNGFITYRYFKKFGDRFFANYQDNVHNQNFYWLTFIEEPTGSEEVKIEKVQEQYAYPNPADNVVYVDIKERIEPEEITVFDAAGAKVETNLHYSASAGRISWNTSEVKAGVYFINIKYKDSSYSVKVKIAR